MNEEAWTSLLREVRTIGSAVAKQMQWDRPDVIEDIVQAFLVGLSEPGTKAFQTLRRVGRGASGYVAVVIRNGIRSHQRHEARTQAMAHAPERAEPDLDEGVEATLLLRTLSPEERTLVRLRFWEGMTHVEIAATLGLAPGAIWMRLSRLLRRLKVERFGG